MFIEETWIRSRKPKWQLSSGMGGNFQPEQVAGLKRNGWQVWSGIYNTEHAIDLIQDWITKIMSTFPKDEFEITGLFNKDNESKISTENTEVKDKNTQHISA